MSHNRTLADIFGPGPHGLTLGDTMTVQQFVNRHHVTLSTEGAGENPAMPDMPLGSAHYRCRLRCQRRQMTVLFSQGPAICKDPTAADVLNCLASDALSYDQASCFEEWAEEYGYDLDSRKAKRSYRLVEKQRDALERVLGASYHAALYDVEPD